MKSKIRLLTNGTIEIGLGEMSDKEYIQVLKIEDHNFKNYLGTSNHQQHTAWFGFTASTGGLSQNHDVQLISMIQYIKQSN